MRKTIQRVIRFNDRSADPKEDLPDCVDPSALASEVISLSSTVDEEFIGPPRASSLHDSCMRMHVLGTKLRVKEVSRVYLQDRFTFGFGNSVHHWIQNSPDLLGDNRIGWWKCRACGKSVGFGGPQKKKCRHCGARKEAIEYQEHSISITGDLFLDGHPDLFFYLKSRICLLEIKTMASDAFDALEAPLASHEWQVLSYLWGCQQLGGQPPVPVYNKAGYILYISKGSGRTFPGKMFRVQDNAFVKQRILNKLQLYADGIKGFPHNLPDPLSECSRSNFSGSRSKYCPCLRYCREQQDNGGQES